MDVHATWPRMAAWQSYLSPTVLFRVVTIDKSACIKAKKLCCGPGEILQGLQNKPRDSVERYNQKWPEAVTRNAKGTVDLSVAHHTQLFPFSGLQTLQT